MHPVGALGFPARRWLRALLAVLLTAWLGSLALAQTAVRGKIVGRIVGYEGRVLVQPGGEGEFQVVTGKNFTLGEKDVIKTEGGGRCRIQFLDRDDPENAGPTIVNMGEATKMAISEFDISLGRPKERQGLLDLLQGTIRAFAKGWGGGSAVSVKGGATVCGIRGSEQVVTYDPLGGTGDGRMTQSALSGDVFTNPQDEDRFGQGRDLTPGMQRLIRSPDPRTWIDTTLTDQRRRELVSRTELSDNQGKTEEQLFQETHGGFLGTDKGRGEGLLDRAMGVGFTAAGLPDCRAVVENLTLNHYLWSDIKQYRDFTFYRDELVNGRFVVSGEVKTDCPGELLNVDVSLDGGLTFVRARFNPKGLTFRYEFDPAGFEDLDIKVRASFDKDMMDAFKAKTAGGGN